jgi:oligoendopeptidase F
MSNPNTVAIPEKKPRKFLPGAFVIDTWQALEPYFTELLERPLHSAADLEKWLHDRSELDTVVQEDAGWRYIHMTRNTSDKEASEAYTYFITEIEPRMAPLENELNKKLLSSAWLSQISNPQYAIYIRDLRKKVEIYRDENIPLFTEIQSDAQQYQVIAGAMTVEMDGKELTLQQAANFLKETDRTRRELVFHRISARRLQDRQALDELYAKLIVSRHKVARNAGFDNFRDYMFASMGRFDYTVQDCLDFHTSISQSIVPIVEKFDRERKSLLGLDSLRPWDRDVDLTGKPALKPFGSGDELMEKTIQCFDRIHPYLGEAMRILKAMNHVDLESRKGKAPGGYNYPLYESGVPFIFMNSANSLNDLVTMVHEGGHAVHSLLVRDLENVGFKSTPSEVAELASMSMELITMEHWDIFFEDQEELRRARRQHLESILRVLPWVATIDKFQHWIYLHPEHTAEERTAEWRKIYSEFAGEVVDWSGEEQVFDNIWQKQLHLFEVPFYYIEYGMAQLGAIAVWRNYRQNPVKALEDYMNALRLGYTCTIGEIYQTAGIRFDFSKEYVNELADFVRSELARTEAGEGR